MLNVQKCLQRKTANFLVEKINKILAFVIDGINLTTKTCYPGLYGDKYCFLLLLVKILLTFLVIIYILSVDHNSIVYGTCKVMRPSNNSCNQFR